MERPMTALEAIMEAGGFDPNRAKPSQVTVLRVEDGKQKMYRLNLKRGAPGRGERALLSEAVRYCPRADQDVQLLVAR